MPPLRSPPGTAAVSAMTERTLPPFGFGRPPAAGSIPASAKAVAHAAGAASAARGTTAPISAPVTRGATTFTTATRAGVLMGVSAIVYAASLAGVASFQAQADAAVVAARSPYLDQVAKTRAANDALESVLAKADAEARALAADYAAVGEDVTGYQARLDQLSALVADVQGSAAALPTRIALPSVSMHGAVGGSSSSSGGKAPRTTATTSASGG